MPVEEVLCFLAVQKYVSARGPERELLLQESLKELETEFGDRFIRIHRNALVSLAHLVGLHREEDGSWCVELDGVPDRVAVSRRHLADVKQQLLAR